MVLPVHDPTLVFKISAYLYILSSFAKFTLVKLKYQSLLLMVSITKCICGHVPCKPRAPQHRVTLRHRLMDVGLTLDNWRHTYAGVCGPNNGQYPNQEPSHGCQLVWLGSVVGIWFNQNLPKKGMKITRSSSQLQRYSRHKAECKGHSGTAAPRGTQDSCLYLMRAAFTHLRTAPGM